MSFGFFNPFESSTGTGGGTGGGSSETIRYTVEKIKSNNIITYKLKQILNGTSTYVGDIISFNAADINFNSNWANNIEEALTYLYNITNGNYNFITFDELNITTTGKTMEEILAEVLTKDLPINTIITGQIYSIAGPGLGWNNAEVKIQITEGGNKQQIYWCSVSSIDTAPYEWESIYYENYTTHEIENTLPWTPVYYELPKASSDVLGGVKIGETLSIDSNGILNIEKTKLRNIEKIEFTSSTGGVIPAIEGATDTYTITYTNGDTFTYQIQNGTKGTNGITPIFRVSDAAIQISVDNGVTYTDLVQLSEITGPSGENGITPIIRATDTAIQVSTDNGDTYKDLIQISEITGLDGISITGALINSSGHLIITLSNGNEIDAGEAKGKDGTSINIKDSLSSTDDLPSTGQSIGDSYLISGNMWIYTGSIEEGSINGFKNAGNIQGPEGRGISNVIIENGELKITYTDGTSAIIGNVIGPSGEQGIQGENGLSAYELFLKNNPDSTLTESEWIESLKGDNGDSVSIISTEKVDGATTVTFSDGTSIIINDGATGEKGKSLEFNWDGTKLGIRTEGDIAYTYIELKGDTGNSGIGIDNIEFTSSTSGDVAGIAGATDIYTITLTDNTKYTFTVYNGKNGSDISMAIDTEMSDTSENAVQNKIIKSYVDGIVGNINTILSTIVEVNE